MKLVLDVKNPWPVIGQADAASGDVSVVFHDFTPLIDQWRGWKMRLLEKNLPAFGKIETTKEERGRSSVEWPIEIIDSNVLDGDGKVVEKRLTVLYFMLEWATAIEVRATPGTMESIRGEALRVLTSGQPDWSDEEALSIAQLYGD